MNRKTIHTLLGIAFGAWSLGAAADITVGVVLSATGSGAVGVQEKNTVELLAPSIGDQKVKFVVLDDEGAPPKTVAHVKKMIADNNVDVIIGPSLAANTASVTQVAAQAGVPLLSLAMSSDLTSPTDGPKKWIFRVAPGESSMVKGIVSHMKSKGVRKIAVIALDDAYGKAWVAELKKAVDKDTEVLVASYNRFDTNVEVQVGGVFDKKPDAVLVAGWGASAILPQATLHNMGYAGLIYQTPMAATRDFLLVGGKVIDGTYIPVGPALVSSQLPDNHPAKAAGMKFNEAYSAKFGNREAPAFGAYFWDSYAVLKAAVPAALGKAKPGTKEFRAALRDAMEGVKNVDGAQGALSISATDHGGSGESGQVMVRVEKGSWKLQKN